MLAAWGKTLLFSFFGGWGWGVGLQAFWSYLERVVRLQSLSGQATTPFVALCHAGQQDKALRTLWQAGPHPFAPLRSQELRHPRICAHNPKHLTKIRMPRERSRPLRGEDVVFVSWACCLTCFDQASTKVCLL